MQYNISKKTISIIGLLALIFINYLIILPCNHLYAEDSVPVSGFDDDDEDEFSFETNVDSSPDFSKNSENKTDYLKDFKFTFSHNYSHGTKKPSPGTITNRSSLRCEFDKTFFDFFLIGFDGKTSLYFPDDHIADYSETYGEVRELYIQAAFDKFMLKAGKQIIVWGETDGDVINDVVSPRDISEFIFIDIEDSRIGQYTGSIDIYSDFGDILFFVTGSPSSNKLPETETRYHRETEGISIIDEEKEFSDNEAGFKWKKTFNKLDISIMGASLYQNDGVLDFENGNIYNKVFLKYNFYGLGINYTRGSFLFKADLSFKQNYPLQMADTNGYLRGKKNDISDTAVGIEFDSNGKYLVNFELTNRHIFNYQDNLLGIERDNTGLYFLFLKNFFHETLDFEYIFFYQFQDNNSFHKTKIEYSFSDEIILSLDYTLFRITDRKSFLWDYRNEDRVGAEFKYYF